MSKLYIVHEYQSERLSRRRRRDNWGQAALWLITPAFWLIVATLITASNSNVPLWLGVSTFTVSIAFCLAVASYYSLHDGSDGEE